MVNYTKKAVRGTVLVFLMMLVAAILSYVFRLILTRKLTTTEYGLFYAIFAFASLFMIFRDFGLVTALSKFIPEFLVKNDKESIK